MKSIHKPFFILLSIFFHLAIVGGFFFLSSYSKKSGLWSGGLSTSSYRVAYVDVKDYGALGPRDLGASGTKVTSKTRTTNNAQRTTPPPTPNPQTPNGTGTSNTPAGGHGPGLDKNGIISNSAPNTLALIRKKILQKKTYPIMAKENGWVGVVKVNFKIKESGKLYYVKVVKGSGHKTLDKAAIASVKRAEPLPYYPDSIVVDLEYRLSF